MFVECRCIPNAAVYFVCTLDESFSKHAIHALLHLVHRLYAGNTGSDVCHHRCTVRACISIASYSLVLGQ